MIVRYIVKGANYLGKVTMDKQDAIQTAREHEGASITEEHVMVDHTVVNVGEIRF